MHQHKKHDNTFTGMHTAPTTSHIITLWNHNAQKLHKLKQWLTKKTWWHWA